MESGPGPTGGWRGRCDAVVVLTMGSDWKTEPRSNRYHYATRFARHAPVYFVQRTGAAGSYRFEPSGAPNLDLLHLPPPGPGPGGWDDYTRQLALALRARNVVRPLYWVYEFRLADWLRVASAGLTVYHATEDYTSDFYPLTAGDRAALVAALGAADGLVAVTPDVLENFLRVAARPVPACLATNGCDYAFFRSGPPVPAPDPAAPPRAIYQGGINRRLDFDLLLAVARGLPRWDFRFLGRAYFGPAESDQERRWKDLLALPNVRWLGEVGVTVIRDEMARATVGLIPFLPLPVIAVSLPLKAYEYVACGLPVVTVPIRALTDEPALFRAATTAEEFRRGMEDLAASRFDPVMLERRAAGAAAQSYDTKFEVVSAFLSGLPGRPPDTGPINLIVLFDPAGLADSAVRRRLQDVSHSPRYTARFAPMTGAGMRGWEPLSFDAVVVHAGDAAPAALAATEEVLRAYPGFKVLWLRSPADCTPAIGGLVRRAGIQSVYAGDAAGSVEAADEATCRVSFTPLVAGDPERAGDALTEILAAHRVGRGPARPLAPPTRFWVGGGGARPGCRAVGPTDAARYPIALPAPPAGHEGGRWGTVRSWLAATARRWWRRLPAPARAAARPLLNRAGRRGG